MSTFQQATQRFAQNLRLRQVIRDGLELHDHIDHIDFDQPLFGRGLELDSLDTLEIVSLLEEEFGVFITDDNRAAFGSLNKLGDCIEEQQ